MTGKLDTSKHKISISIPDLIKLIGVIFAISMSWAMTSSRLTLIEKGVQEGQQTLARMEDRLNSLETKVQQNSTQERDDMHDMELRLQRLELTSSPRK